MIKNWLKKKMEIINEKKKNNEGFTLVELIVVIVILAILIGVTIGGIYMYVGQARKNTDINNASAIESTLSTIATNEAVFTWANADTAPDDIDVNVKKDGTVKPGVAIPANTFKFGEKDLTSEVNGLFPNGLPEEKSADTDYHIIIKGGGKAQNGSVQVIVTGLGKDA